MTIESVLWWQGRLCSYDCESTDTDVETARIVKAAVVLVGGGLAPETLTLLADPGVEISEEATAVHGVTNEYAREHGLSACDVVGEVVDLLASLAGGCPLVVMRAPFDLTILDREARRYGLTPLQERCDLRVVDPSVIDRHLDKYRKGSRTLTALCEHYQAGLDEAHDAASDALAAARVAYRIGQRGEVVRRVFNASTGAEKAALVAHWARVRNDLGLLHRAQVVWARDQAVSLAQHFEKQGDPKPVSTDWPLIPLPPAPKRYDPEYVGRLEGESGIEREEATT